MAVDVHLNERSCAIDIISEINVMLSKMTLSIRKAGGESTLSDNKKSLFPDVLLYADKSQARIVQGWELKLPDTPITDVSNIENAEKKARSLGLNSFVVFNIKEAILFVVDERNHYVAVKNWNKTNHINTRADVALHRQEWLELAKEMVVDINEFLETGKIHSSQLTDAVADTLLLEIIERNKIGLAEHLKKESIKNSAMLSSINNWWHEVKKEYIADEPNMYSAYAKVILVHWVNRFLFAHMIKKYHTAARSVSNIDMTINPSSANQIFDTITQQCDFFNVFASFDYDACLDANTWVDLYTFNSFLEAAGELFVDHEALQGILEKTVATSKREIRGQFTTPVTLAKLLAKITVKDWTGECIDPCCGTGTIAKAVLEEKLKLLGAVDAYSTTWASDKFSFPLQIANISFVKFESMNLPCRVFQENMFKVHAGERVNITNPQTGKILTLPLPQFDAIVSNLPFIAFENIDSDEVGYINELSQTSSDEVGEQLGGKADIYAHMILAAYSKLATNGRLGVIVSNAWLGVEWGEAFFKIICCYFDVRNILISGKGRWFINADVVTTILVLEKRGLTQSQAPICYSIVNASLDELGEKSDVFDCVVDSVNLQRELNPKYIHSQTYSITTIERLLSLGVSQNALFHKIDWLDRIADKLVSITRDFDILRGERRGWNPMFYPQTNHGIEPRYIRPVLKNPKHLHSLLAEPDIDAFCCDISEESLQESDHYGALNWINKFSQKNNGTGKPLKQSLSKAGHYWYEMPDSAKATMLTLINPNERLFVARFPTPTFVDQRFTRINPKSEKIDVEIYHALTNSVLGLFYIEAIGFGRGLGVLDTNSTNFKKVRVLDPKLINTIQRNHILELFGVLLQRDILPVRQEVHMADRIAFDKYIFEVYGIADYYEPVKESLISMQKIRFAVHEYSEYQ